MPEIPIQHFVDQAIYSMNQFCPNWQANFRQGEMAPETFCIPVCLDVNKTWLHVSPTDLQGSKAQQGVEKNVAGNVGEQEFLRAFRKLQIGGILIGGFNSEDLMRDLKDQNVKSFQNRQRRFKKRNMHFEEDFLFVHPIYGITIIEVKAKQACFVNEPDIQKSSQYTKAEPKIRQQMAKTLPEIFEMLTEHRCPIEINGCFAFPFIEKTGACSHSGGLPIIDKGVFSSTEKLRAFVSHHFKLGGQTLSLHGENLPEMMIRFVAGIIGHRSVEYFSEGYNALAIHRLLDTFQEALTKYDDISLPKRVYQVRPLKWPGSENAKYIFLTGEQVKYLEDQSNCQIISGPPGTGKTLLLLLKALDAAREVPTTECYLALPGSSP